jgi:hypothetical protein
VEDLPWLWDWVDRALLGWSVLSGGPYLVTVNEVAVDWVGVAWNAIYKARESEEAAVARQLEA